LSKRLERGRFHLAAGQGWHGLFDKGAVVDAVGRDRLAAAAEDLDAGDRGLVDKRDSPVFMRLLWMQLHGISWHTSVMDAASLSPLDGLDVEALKALVVGLARAALQNSLLRKRSGSSIWN
jgi:hypothetical protein